MARGLRTRLATLAGLEQFVGCDLWSDDLDSASGWLHRDIPLSPCEVVGPISLQDTQNGQQRPCDSLPGRKLHCMRTQSRIHYAFCPNRFSQSKATRDRIGFTMLTSDPGQAFKDSGVWMHSAAQPGAHPIPSLGYGRLQLDVPPGREHAAVARADGQMRRAVLHQAAAT